MLHYYTYYTSFIYVQNGGIGGGGGGAVVRYPSPSFGGGFALNPGAPGTATINAASNVGGNGGVNTGGGGGANCLTAWSSGGGWTVYGGTGGSGIVVISYASYFPSATTTNAVRTVVNNQQIYTFLTSGKLTFNV